MTNWESELVSSLKLTRCYYIHSSVIPFPLSLIFPTSHMHVLELLFAQKRKRIGAMQLSLTQITRVMFMDHLSPYVMSRLALN